MAKAGRPQSNQRGIETCSFCHKGLCVDACLNRTSVGLKPPRWPKLIWRRSWPQSNQRGIETLSGLAPGRGPSGPQSNQRGIETGFNLNAILFRQQPQSNQRGIETEWKAMRNPFLSWASIEPAWD